MSIMEPCITFCEVSKLFQARRQKIHALHQLTLEVGKGEVFGFIGPNGAGKSTTIKLLLGFIRADAGSMAILGRRIGGDEFRQHIGYLPEIPCLYENLTARETLHFAGRLHQMPPGLVQQRLPQLLARVDLAHAADQRVATFSKGMKQRLGMAAALIHDPRVLILDEPMSGLDPVGRHLIKHLILELHGQGKTIFFSSHILGDVETLCSRIGVIHKGHLLYQGAMADFRRSDDFETRFIQVIEEWNHAQSC
jgi:ABC-2 type transport system ATP-binding protein